MPKAKAAGGLAEFAVRAAVPPTPHDSLTPRVRVQKIVKRSQDPAFRAAIFSVPRMKLFLDAIEPCGHPRDVIGGKKKKTLACNRAGCWLRTCNIYSMLKTLFDDADDGVVNAIPGGVKDAGRAALYMRLEEIANQYGVGTDVYQNLFGEGTDTSAPGFYEGGKGPSFSRMVECVPRDGEVSLRKAGIKKVSGTSYKAAALCSFKASQLPSHHPSSPPPSQPHSLPPPPPPVCLL